MYIVIALVLIGLVLGILSADPLMAFTGPFVGLLFGGLLAAAIGFGPNYEFANRTNLLPLDRANNGREVYVEGIGNAKDGYLAYLFSYRDKNGQLRVKELQRNKVILHEWNKPSAVVKRYHDTKDHNTAWSIGLKYDDVYELFVPVGTVKESALPPTAES